MEANKEAILNFLRTNYNTEDLKEQILETSRDYLDEDWEEEFEDEDEAYQETGRGEAEAQVCTEISIEIFKQLNLEENRRTNGTDLRYEKYKELIGEEVWETIFEVYGEILDKN